MKRIGFIAAPRVKGDLDLGGTGTLTVPGVATINGLCHLYGMSLHYAGLTTAGNSNFGGPIIASSSLGVAGPSNLNGPVACNSSLGVAGPTNLNGAVICSSSLAIAAGGLLTIPQRTVATQLPAADPAVAGELWCNAGVVTRSAG